MPESRAMTASGMQQRDYEQAVSTMHDHLSRIAPGMCPMSPPLGHTQGPAHPVPAAVGGPEPHSAKASKADRAALKAKRKARLAKKAARAAALKARARRRKVQAMVVKGALSVDEARVKLGLEPFGTPETTQKAVFTAAGPVPADEAPATEALIAAVKAATAPLVKRIREQEKTARKTAKLVAAIGDQPDTRNAPFRGAGTYVNKTSAAQAGPRTPAEAAALAQTGNLQRLAEQTKSYNPVEREAARRELAAQLGVTPMTGTPDTTHPFRT